MSYEITGADIENTAAAVWRLSGFTFTGAAILLRDKAAYRATSFDLEALAAPELRSQTSGVRPQTSAIPAAVAGSW